MLVFVSLLVCFFVCFLLFGSPMLVFGEQEALLAAEAASGFVAVFVSQTSEAVNPNW